MNLVRKICLFTLVISINFIYSELFEGYTLFSPTGGGPGGNIGGTSYLLNNNKETVHTWAYTNGAASMPYLLADSSIIYPYRVANPTMSSGGVGGGVRPVQALGVVNLPGRARAVGEVEGTYVLR